MGLSRRVVIIVFLFLFSNTLRANDVSFWSNPIKFVKHSTFAMTNPPDRNVRIHEVEKGPCKAPYWSRPSVGYCSVGKFKETQPGAVECHYCSIAQLDFEWQQQTNARDLCPDGFTYQRFYAKNSIGYACLKDILHDPNGKKVCDNVNAQGSCLLPLSLSRWEFGTPAMDVRGAHNPERQMCGFQCNLPQNGQLAEANFPCQEGFVARIPYSDKSMMDYSDSGDVACLRFGEEGGQ